MEAGDRERSFTRSPTRDTQPAAQWQDVGADQEEMDLSKFATTSLAESSGVVISQVLNRTVHCCMALFIARFKSHLYDGEMQAIQIWSTSTELPSMCPPLTLLYLDFLLHPCTDSCSQQANKSSISFLIDMVIIDPQDTLLKTILVPGAGEREVSELFTFRRPCHRPRGKPSTVLQLTEKQHDIM